MSPIIFNMTFVTFFQKCLYSFVINATKLYKRQTIVN
jgi:hypothetical protein